MCTSDQRALLVRELRARILDISESGCCIEIRRRLEVGTVGTMRLQIGTGEYADDLEVVRCRPVEGAPSLYHVGVRFLWTTPRRAGSIRQAMALHVAELDSPDANCVM